jgi:putative ABC transport system substrate-binding protein
VEAGAHAIGLQIQVLNASSSREIDAAFATFGRERPDALLVGPDPFFTSRRVQLILLAARHGGLMSYGASIVAPPRDDFLLGGKPSYMSEG